MRPVFAGVVGELRAADPSNVQGPVKQNASPGDQSEAPRPWWKPGQEQNPGPENQDSQHMLEQPRGSFPDFSTMGHRSSSCPKKTLGGRFGIIFVIFFFGWGEGGEGNRGLYGATGRFFCC